MINRRALFTDETENFKKPYQPKAGDTVTLTLRTLKNDVLKAYVCFGGAKKQMNKCRTDETFDYYETSFRCHERQVSYYFYVSDEDDLVYYNRLGAVTNHQPEYNFSFTPGVFVPEWAFGRVFYQIYVDRFCNGNPDNDVEDNEYFYTGGHSRRVRDWNKIPETLDVNNFYGGDLQGVRQKLDYLQTLGVEAVYFNPMFISPSNHKYDTQDYDYIDPHLAVVEEDADHAMQDWEHHNGYAVRYIRRVTSKVNLEKSNAYFAGLVAEMHARGMKVVIDGVFNHCGSFNKWLDREGIYLNKPGFEKGAFQSVESPYRSYFKFRRPSSAASEYEGWWGFKTLPKLNYEKSEELCEHMWKLGAKWVSAPYNVDGWRLDVAADLGHSEKFNHKFWRNFHSSVRQANPQAFIFAEHYGNPSAWLEGGEWDSVMNYDAFMEPVTWFLTGMEKHSREYDGSRLNNGRAFFDSMFANMAHLPRPALDSAVNQLSNHDHSRFLTRTNRTVGTLKSMGGDAAGVGTDKRVMALAILIQMTWPGCPALYYGDEVGQVGWTDPDCRRTYPWGNEDWSLFEIYRSAIALRKHVHCLKMGSLIELDAGNGYIAYGRFDGEDAVAVIVNNTDGEIALTVPVWQLGVSRTDTLALKYCVGYGEQSPAHIREVKFGRMYLTLPPRSGCVYGKKLSVG